MQNTSTQIDSSIIPLHRSNTSKHSRSPYYFTAITGSEDTADALYDSPIATLLLGPKATTSSVQILLSVEAIFDTATLMAFSRSPYASSLEITTTASLPVYVYDSRVLAILLVPFLATVLGTWGRWRVAVKDVLVGYDPVEIARRGPVVGMSEASEASDAVGRRKVRAVRETRVSKDGISRSKERIVVEADS